MRDAVAREVFGRGVVGGDAKSSMMPRLVAVDQFGEQAAREARQPVCPSRG